LGRAWTERLNSGKIRPFLYGIATRPCGRDPLEKSFAAGTFKGKISLPVSFTSTFVVQKTQMTVVKLPQIRHWG